MESTHPASIILGRWLVPVVPHGQVLQHHALVIGQDGRIAHVMPNDRARALAGPETEVHDLSRDHCIIPGQCARP